MFLNEMFLAETPVLFHLVWSHSGATHPNGKGEGYGRLEAPFPAVFCLEKPVDWKESGRGSLKTCVAHQRDAQVSSVCSSVCSAAFWSKVETCVLLCRMTSGLCLLKF